MLKRLLHWLVAWPRVYDWVQFMAGAKKVRRRLSRAMAEVGRPELIVDIGGGTGAAREFVPAGSHYVCLDIDPAKVREFLRKNPDQWAVVGDAARLPFEDASVGTVLCLLVAHHLPDEVLRRFLVEAKRVLLPGGKLVFIDPLWRPRRLPGRLLWRYDRGSFPRTVGLLREELSRQFHVLRWDQFAFFHAYVLGVAEKSAFHHEPTPASVPTPAPVSPPPSASPSAPAPTPLSALG